jgi:hypothetical protein
MAKHHYSADSAFLVPSCPLFQVRSSVTGGCAVVPGVGPTADGIFRSVIIAAMS